MARPIVAIVGRPNVGKSTLFNRDIAQMLRRSRRRVIVAANKADSPHDQHLAHEVLELGFDAPALISAQHGLGVGDLLDQILDALPPPEAEAGADDKADRLAIMGRPNVGKSSLLNALLGDERALVSPTPGTTRDPVDTEMTYDGVPVVLIDTAGIRRKSSSRDRLERYSLLRGIHAMERADAVLLVVDASAGVLAQDQHVAGYALEAGKGLVIVVNKIDLVDAAARTPAHWRKALASDFKFAAFAPVVTVSAKTSEGIGALLPVALEVVGQRRIKMPPNELNRVLREAFLEHPPPSFNGRRLNLTYATQAGA